jgi:PAS domain S-box-containing protein
MRDIRDHDSRQLFWDSCIPADLYRVLFEEAVDGMFITDPSRRFVAANPQWLAMTGYSFQTLAAMSFFDMIPPEDLAQQPHLIDILRQDPTAVKECCLRRSDGSRLHVEVRGRMLPGDNMLGMVRDITERKRTEAVSEERGRELAALQALGVAVNSSLSLEQVSTAALQGMLTAVQPDLAFLFLREGDTLRLQEVAPPEARQRLGAVPEHRVGECLCGLTVREGKPLYSLDIHQDNRCTWDECKNAGIRSFASLPMRIGKDIIGVIGLASLTDRDFEAQAGFLETLAHQVSLALANARLYQSAQGELAERKQAEESLRRIEWMLSKDLPSADSRQHLEPTFAPAYGDLLQLNTCRVILDAVGRTMLTDIVSDCLSLLDTAVAVHEKNGDYALGIFSSGWCRFMNLASHRLCNTEDNREALRCGRWLCHESCWNKASSPAIAGDGPIDIECTGGLHLYAVPIQAGGEVVGSINLGYGDPPRDPATLLKLADTYGVSVEELSEQAGAYESRPPYIVELAKRRLEVSARLIGEIVQRRKMATILRESEKRWRAIFERSPVGILLLDSQSLVLDCNERFADIFGVARERYIGIKLFDKIPIGPIRQNLLNSLAGQGIYHFDGAHTSIFSGKEVYLDIVSEKIAEDLHIVVMADITEQRQAALAQEKLQAQLLQAQKMESVGRLAGGVAHDFNNMLTAILGHAQLGLEHCRPSEPIHADLKVIENAAHRSADLVRQLLAFARKQPVTPKVLDLNDCVAGLLKMLARLIGEDIDLVWKPGAELWPIKMDPSQIDQLLANLCVNARDAIDGVGKVTIESKNIIFDADYCAVHPGFIRGEYVLLAVSDDGCGIDKEILEHIFEPFFTTKAVGKGTGLGLATVFGMVKQNEGFINVYSEPGSGSTFKIYLPRYAAAAVQAKAEKEAEIPKGSGELVLLVEDEAVILNVGRAMLERLGYTVLAAASPREALRETRAHAEEIQLLITDVIMPEMNGRDLAKILIGIKPELKCLFTSGYTADVIAHHGVLDADIHFIQKPFSFMDLAVKVRELLPGRPKTGKDLPEKG